MSIKSISSLLVAYPEPHYRNVERYLTLVRIEDSSGQVGWGEAISQFPEATRATKALIDGGLSELLIGRDPMNIEGLWHAMLDRCFWTAAKALPRLPSAPSTWRCGISRDTFWGSRWHRCWEAGLRTGCRPWPRSFSTWDDLDWTVNEFAMHKESGFRILKAGWGMTPDSPVRDGPGPDLLLVDRIRAAVGHEVDVILDVAGPSPLLGLAHGHPEVQRLGTLSPALDRAAVALARSGGARQAEGRGHHPDRNRRGRMESGSYKRLIESGGVDVVQLDPGRCLGITGCRQVLKMIEAANLDASAHTWSSALNTAASLHMLANSPNHAGMDLKPHPSPMQHELVTDPWVQVDGCVHLRDAPGLGVTVNEAVVAKYAWR